MFVKRDWCTFQPGSQSHHLYCTAEVVAVDQNGCRHLLNIGSQETIKLYNDWVIHIDIGWKYIVETTAL